nr:MAG TPA: hypothetical protein [Bacteriophage sp.]
MAFSTHLNGFFCQNSRFSYILYICTLSKNTSFCKSFVSLLTQNKVSL